MIPRPFLAGLTLCAACRADPIPEAARYPAGTAFRAEYRMVDGTRLRIIDAGSPDGTPVVFLHGFGASMYAWRHTLAPVAAAGYRVVAFDNRGFGFSGKPPGGEEAYSNAAYTRLVVALLDTLGIASAALVGHSMGGAIAVQVALEHPDRVRGLVLLGTAGLGVRWPGVLKVARRPLIGAIATGLRSRWVTGRLLRSCYADPARVTEADVDQYYAPVPTSGVGRALRGALREFRFDALAGRLQRGEALATLRTPTLIVWGAHDRWIPVSYGSRLASALPRAVFVVVPNAGHAVAEESPDDVNRLLLDFLKDGLSRIPENVAWSTRCSQLPRCNSSLSIRSIPPRSAS